ncbi:hypothetical protein [Glaciecola sp. SC05]|uniref:hypothetical protein n=1 Tax=Glaciecola sp. SC05 TaxID=1987355 RepID=UPI0035282C69
MQPFVFLLLMVCFFASSAVCAAQTDTIQKRADAISIMIQPQFAIDNETTQLKSLKEKMSALNIPAVSIAFMENHKITWTLTEGVTDFESQKNIDSKTVFQTAIIAKPVFAEVLLQYRQENDLGFDKDVNNLLKSWQLPQETWSQSIAATSPSLLSESPVTSADGFSAYSDNSNMPSMFEVLKQAGAENTKTIQAYIQPTATFKYSGNDSKQAQLDTIERPKVASSALDDTPNTGLSNASSNAGSQSAAEQLAKNVAAPHRSTELATETNGDLYLTNTTTVFWTTPSELLMMASKFHKSHRGLGKTPITSKTAAQMLRPQLASMGIGFFLEHQDSILTSFPQGATNDGFSSNLFIDPETGNGIAIMTNSDNGDVLINDLLSRVSEVYGWDEYPTTERDMTIFEPAVAELKVVEMTVVQPPKSAVALVAEGEQF